MKFRLLDDFVAELERTQQQIAAVNNSAEQHQAAAARQRSGSSQSQGQGQQQQQGKEMCTQHSMELVYWCLTDDSAICSDCALFGGEHKGHSFEKLSAVYEKHTRGLEGEMAALQNRLEHLQLLEESVETNIRLVRAAKEERAAELQGRSGSDGISDLGDGWIVDWWLCGGIARGQQQRDDNALLYFLTSSLRSIISCFGCGSHALVYLPLPCCSRRCLGCLCDLLICSLRSRLCTAAALQDMDARLTAQLKAKLVTLLGMSLFCLYCPLAPLLLLLLLLFLLHIRNIL